LCSWIYIIYLFVITDIYANTIQVFPYDAGAGAVTPHKGVEYNAINKEGIIEGEELILSYGSTWNKIQKVKNEMIIKSKKNGYTGSREKKGFVDGIHKKWDQLDAKELYQVPEELPTERAKRYRLAEGIATDSSSANIKNGEKPYSEYRLNDYHPSEKEAAEENNTNTADDNDSLDIDSKLGIIKDLSWLDDNGVCLSSGRLRIDKSTIQSAGRGVFATTHISRGDVVITSPLIASKFLQMKDVFDA